MTDAGVGVLILAAAILTVGFTAGIFRNEYRSRLRSSAEEPLSQADIESLREQAKRVPSLAAGRAKQRLLMVDKPDFVRKQERVLSIVTTTAFWVTAILVLAGLVLFVV